MLNRLREYVSSWLMTSSGRNGAGASSTSFWLRRCTEQSRVEYTVKSPKRSRPHWVSTWRALSMNFSMKYSSRSPPCIASWFM